MNFNRTVLRRLGAFALMASAAGVLAGCEDNMTGGSVARAYRPLPAEMLALMDEKGTSKNAPVLIRTFKKEAEFEIWKMKADGHYALLKSYPMCRWSGQLGPKVREGDRQVPEGFYTITPGQMNPNSAYYLSFNVGYPNAYDRAYGHTGGSIMVHGACSSAGCFSMTDQQIAEIYALAREGFAGGQRAIQMQSLPFRMTPENLAKYRSDPNLGFWKQLKEGSDNFDVTRQEVTVGVCNRHYVFNASAADGSHLDASAACPPLKRDESLRNEVAAKDKHDEAKVAELVAQGVKPVRTIYADGGQHPNFAYRFAEASRPDALAQGPVDIPIDESKGKKTRSLMQMAAAKTKAADIASADRKPELAEAAAAAPPAKTETTLLSRLFSPKPEAQAAVEPIAVDEPAVPRPANVPLPPRRLHASSPVKAKVSKVSSTEAPKPIAGSPAVLQTGFTAVATAQH
jgi:murein L,D-transpeptidase YafK